MSETTKRRRGRPRAKERDEQTRDSLPKPPEPPAEPKPSRSRASSASSSRGPGRPSVRDKLETQLAEQLGALALTVVLFHPADGQAIMRRAPDCAAALARLAEQNPRIRRLLESGMTSSAWLGVAIAFGGLAMEIGANHGQFPKWLATPAQSPAGETGGVFGNLSHLFDAPSAKSKAAHPSANGAEP